MKLADAVAITSPEAIFLFGGLAAAGELIFQPTRLSMEANLLKVFRGKVGSCRPACRNPTPQSWARRPLSYGN